MHLCHNTECRCKTKRGFLSKIPLTAQEYLHDQILTVRSVHIYVDREKVEHLLQMIFILAFADIFTLIGLAMGGIVFYNGGMYCHAPRMSYFIGLLTCGQQLYH